MTDVENYGFYIATNKTKLQYHFLRLTKVDLIQQPDKIRIMLSLNELEQLFIF